MTWLARTRFHLDPDDPARFWFTHDCLPIWRGEHEPEHRTDLMPSGADGWHVQQADPLTVTPSIHCTACGTHGFITDGQWVPV